MRQTRRVGDEERGYCLMSWLPKRISAQPARHPRANSRGKSIGHNASVRDRLGFADEHLRLRLNQLDRSSPERPLPPNCDLAPTGLELPLTTRVRLVASCRGMAAAAQPTAGVDVTQSSGWFLNFAPIVWNGSGLAR
jgi:hypothetical protein